MRPQLAMFWRMFRRAAYARRLFLTAILLGLFAAVSHSALFASGLGWRLEHAWTDLCFRVRGRLPAPEKALVVYIDEGSYEHFHIAAAQPFPRQLMAEALTRLASAHAAAAGLDIAFQDPSDEPSTDEKLAAALKSLPTVIGMFEDTFRSTAPDGRDVIRRKSVMPLPAVARSAAAIAPFGLPLDFGTSRRFALRDLTGTEEPTLFEALVNLARPALSLPDSSSEINYYGPPGAIRSLSIETLLDLDQADLVKAFEGSLVLIGVKRAVDLPRAGKDSFQTPFSGAPMFGVEIFATMAANVLEQHWLRRPLQKAEIPLMALLAFFLTVRLATGSPLRSFLELTVLAVTWCAASFAGFCSDLLIPGACCFLVILPGALLISSIAYHFWTKRLQHQIESIFGVNLGIEEDLRGEK